MTDRHPTYPVWQLANGLYTSGGPVLIGNQVAHRDDLYIPIGTVVGIYLDGTVELSTGDTVTAADLVLLRQAIV